MKIKIDLNIYQLPENKQVARQDVTDWGLEKIMAFAEDQLGTYNRLCCVAGAGPDGGDNIGGHLKSLYEAVPVEKSEIKKMKHTPGKWGHNDNLYESDGIIDSSGR